MGSDRMKIKKLKKKNAIEEIAFTTFCEKGIAKTTIDEIAEKAGVAKGTFYLYYKSKADLIENLILREATRVLNDAIGEMSNATFKSEDRIRKIIFIVDYIITYFQKNPQFLEFIHKNLYKGLLREENRDIVEQLVRQITPIATDSDTLQKKLYLILELVDSVAYNAIILAAPYKISEIKPMLYESIKQIVVI